MATNYSPATYAKIKTTLNIEKLKNEHDPKMKITQKRKSIPKMKTTPKTKTTPKMLMTPKIRIQIFVL